MRLRRPLVAGLVIGAGVGFVGALLRPRPRPTIGSAEPLGTAEPVAAPAPAIRLPDDGIEASASGTRVVRLDDASTGLIWTDGR
jgi:hypothetical protein